MEIVYRASDGADFETEEECRRYESGTDPSAVTMVDFRGDITDDIYITGFVVFKTAQAQENFMLVCTYKGISTEGLNRTFVEGAENVYFWDNRIKCWRTPDEYLSEPRLIIKETEELIAKYVTGA